MENKVLYESKIGIDEICEIYDCIVEIQKKLTAERKRLGLTQKDIARKLGWKQSEVSRFENSEVIPRYDTVLLYALCVGMKDELAGRFEEKIETLRWEKAQVFVYATAINLRDSWTRADIRSTGSLKSNVKKGAVVYA
jgi:transcriptional regulator with XRE-family HTH domain